MKKENVFFDFDKYWDIYRDGGYTEMCEVVKNDLTMRQAELDKQIKGLKGFFEDAPQTLEAEKYANRHLEQSVQVFEAEKRKIDSLSKLFCLSPEIEEEEIKEASKIEAKLAIPNLKISKNKKGYEFTHNGESILTLGKLTFDKEFDKKSPIKYIAYRDAYKDDAYVASDPVRIKLLTLQNDVEGCDLERYDSKKGVFEFDDICNTADCFFDGGHQWIIGELEKIHGETPKIDPIQLKAKSYKEAMPFTPSVSPNLGYKKGDKIVKKEAIGDRYLIINEIEPNRLICTDTFGSKIQVLLDDNPAIRKYEFQQKPPLDLKIIESKAEKAENRFLIQYDSKGSIDFYDKGGVIENTGSKMSVGKSMTGYIVNKSQDVKSANLEEIKAYIKHEVKNKRLRKASISSTVFDALELDAYEIADLANFPLPAFDYTQKDIDYIFESLPSDSKSIRDGRKFYHHRESNSNALIIEPFARLDNDTFYKLLNDAKNKNKLKAVRVSVGEVYSLDSVSNKPTVKIKSIDKEGNGLSLEYLTGGEGSFFLPITQFKAAIANGEYLKVKERDSTPSVSTIKTRYRVGDLIGSPIHKNAVFELIEKRRVNEKGFLVWDVKHQDGNTGTIGEDFFGQYMGTNRPDLSERTNLSKVYNVTFDEYMQLKAKEYGDSFDYNRLGGVIKDSYYEEIVSKVLDGYLISENVYKALRDFEQTEFNRLYNFRNDKVVVSDTAPPVPKKAENDHPTTLPELRKKLQNAGILISRNTTQHFTKGDRVVVVKFEKLGNDTYMLDYHLEKRKEEQLFLTFYAHHISFDKTGFTIEYPNDSFIFDYTNEKGELSDILDVEKFEDFLIDKGFTFSELNDDFKKGVKSIANITINESQNLRVGVIKENGRLIYRVGSYNPIKHTFSREIKYPKVSDAIQFIDDYLKQNPPMVNKEDENEKAFTTLMRKLNNTPQDASMYDIEITHDSNTYYYDYHGEIGRKIGIGTHSTNSAHGIDPLSRKEEEALMEGVRKGEVSIYRVPRKMNLGGKVLLLGNAIDDGSIPEKIENKAEYLRQIAIAVLSGNKAWTDTAFAKIVEMDKDDQKEVMRITKELTAGHKEELAEKEAQKERTFKHFISPQYRSLIPKSYEQLSEEELMEALEKTKKSYKSHIDNKRTQSAIPVRESIFYMELMLDAKKQAREHNAKIITPSVSELKNTDLDSERADLIKSREESKRKTTERLSQMRTKIDGDWEEQIRDNEELLKKINLQIEALKKGADYWFDNFDIVVDGVDNVDTSGRFKQDEDVIFLPKSGGEVVVNFRGYNGPSKAVIFGKPGSGYNQMEVDISQLKKYTPSVPEPKMETKKENSIEVAGTEILIQSVRFEEGYIIANIRVMGIESGTVTYKPKGIEFTDILPSGGSYSGEKLFKEFVEKNKVELKEALMEK